MAERISGADFRRMILGAYDAFLRSHEEINNLNVFPVPDGDTGTNMLLTLGAASRGLQEAADAGIGTLAKRTADSAIMGARGNSGVILAQLFRGIARGLAGKEEASSCEIGKAFQYGVLYAYRAVAQPVEGTILTVAKGVARGARRAVREERSFDEVLAAALQVGEEELARTPLLLKALRDAGVVDAGGKGLLVFLQGCAEGLRGEVTAPEGNSSFRLTAKPSLSGEAVNLAHPYCTEFLVKKSRVSGGEARQALQNLGESLILAEGDELLKVHIHTAHPGQVLEMALTWGSLHDIKIDNMADQHQERLHTAARPQVPLAVLAVSPGEGLSAMLRQLGASAIVSGGQTMNPPVEEFIAAIHSGDAERYIILPNNKNIVLAAKQVKKLLGDRVEVVPTVDVQQGLAALLAFQPEASLEDNVGWMEERRQEVVSGSVTKAVRDSVVDGQAVKAGHFLGIKAGKVAVQGECIAKVLLALLQRLVSESAEVATLYYGSELTVSEAENLAAQVREAFPALTVELYDGGQPLYPLLVSVE